MKLRDKLLISLGFICLMGFAIINFFSIQQLKEHHINKYEKYSYAYDCLKEAEITYWDYKCSLINEVQNYITTVAPSSNLRGYAIVDECEKYNVDICFVLAQAEIESHFGTKGLGSRFNNVFNVNVHDAVKSEKDMNKNYIYQYPNESIEPYLQLLTTKYLVNKIESDLLVKYTDVDGLRYATDANYENKLRSKYNSIVDSTEIAKWQGVMKNYAIKCNRI